MQKMPDTVYFTEQRYKKNQRLISKMIFEDKLSNFASIELRFHEVIEELSYIDHQGRNRSIIIVIIQDNERNRKAVIDFESMEQIEHFVRPDWLIPVKDNNSGDLDTVDYS